MPAVIPIAVAVAVSAVAAGAAVGVSQLTKPDSTSPKSVLPAEGMAAAEQKIETTEQERIKRRRQVVARQNTLVKTSPAGAKIQSELLGGPNLVGTLGK